MFTVLRIAASIACVEPKATRVGGYAPEFAEILELDPLDVRASIRWLRTTSLYFDLVDSTRLRARLRKTLELHPDRPRRSRSYWAKSSWRRAGPKKP